MEVTVMAEKKRQIQLCFKWPGRGLKVDSMRIASIDMDEWEAMLAYVSKTPGAFPTFKKHIMAPLPCKIRRENLSQFLQECDGLIDYDRFGEPEMSALSTLSMVASQALDQREAELSVEYWEGAYFDTQVFIAPGIDLLADLGAIDSTEVEPEQTDE
jgi:hypothetical protein